MFELNWHLWVPGFLQLGASMYFDSSIGAEKVLHMLTHVLQKYKLRFLSDIERRWIVRYILHEAH